MAQPTRPQQISFSGLIFPNDLQSYNYFMTFVFHEYKRQSLFGEPTINIVDTPIALPMPDRINDQQVVIWNTDRLTDKAAQVGGGFLSNIEGAKQFMQTFGSAVGMAAEVYGYHQGLTINPFLIMLFKEPTFKEFTFSWTLTPRTLAESQTLDKIVKRFRRDMLPKKNAMTGGFLLDYPYIVKPQFVPQQYLFPFKFCAVKDIRIDYTGAGSPSFFVSEAPTTVKLDIHLTEIDLWMRDDPELQKGL